MEVCKNARIEQPWDKYVYILGAGFSAPLGIPVMKNFLTKAKDLYNVAPEKYKSFEVIFNKINCLYECAHYYDTDLNNIEEILSILLTQDTINGDDNASIFRNFICEVIRAYTPAKEMFGFDNKPEEKTYPWTPYTDFVCSLFQATINYKEHQVSTRLGPQKKYIPDDITFSVANKNFSVITLNYDMVLEMCLEQINKYYGKENEFCCDAEPDYTRPCLAKIHGSLSQPESIIPPTWAKGNLNSDNLTAWKLAGELLKNANHIRIIGYSLPDTDSYIKYLLKATCISDKTRLTNLKDIKVYDKYPNVGDKYTRFMKTFNLKEDFFAKDIKSILKNIKMHDSTGTVRDIFKNIDEAYDSTEQQDNHNNKPHYSSGIVREINRMIEDKIEKSFSNKSLFG